MNAQKPKQQYQVFTEGSGSKLKGFLKFFCPQLVTATLLAHLVHNATTPLAIVPAGPIFEETNATVV